VRCAARRARGRRPAPRAPRHLASRCRRVARSLASTLPAAKGLLALKAGNWSLAAAEFLRVPAAAEGVLAGVVHVDDVAMYALVTALATRSREELRALLGDPALHSLLELAPPFRAAVHAFVMTKYAACLGKLHALEVRRRRGRAQRSARARARAGRRRLTCRACRSTIPARAAAGPHTPPSFRRPKSCAATCTLPRRRARWSRPSAGAR